MSKDTIKISVVMATYNGEKYIRKQMDSILSQSLTPNEIVVIDDSSVDGTYELVKDYLSQNYEGELVIKQHASNKGYRCTFFEAITLAKYDIIFLADQDDIWCLNKIENMTQYFIDNPSMLALNTSNYLIDDSDNLIGKKKNTKCTRIKKVSLHDVLNYNVSMGCTMAFRNKFQKEIIPFQSELASMALPHDWVINIIAAMKDGLYKTNEKTIYYRLHSNNTLGLSRATTISGRILAYKSLLNQKRAMGSILKLYNSEMNDLQYIEDMLMSYIYRIDALERKSLWRYLRIIFREHLLRYCRLTTIGYDIKLIILERRAGINEVNYKKK